MFVFECVTVGIWVLAVFTADASLAQDTLVIYDVTTIYRLKEPLPEYNASQGFSSLQDINHPGVMEVHARTNARGLPFRLSNKTVLGSNIGVKLPEWPSTLGTSGYTTANFTISTINSSLMTSIFNTYGLNQGLVLSEPTGSVVSPPLPPGLNRICVSLVFYSSQPASVDLHLQQGTTLSPLGKIIEESRMGEGWTHKIFDSEIPEESCNDTRIVVTASSPSNTTLIVLRIAGCSSEDPEDVLELQEKNITVANQVVDVAHTNTGYELSKDDGCLNGGLRVEWGNNVTEESSSCVCPPGFTGDTCSEGCGANSYGSDCGGVCSLSERRCRGMVLCKPMIGCDCAPGFKGLYCDMNCYSGEYGAGCRQRCGQCAGEACDIYTGICYSGCQSGYVQPYCKQMYAYPLTAPKVDVVDFFSVSVSGNLSVLQGQGDPRYYQLQYKLKNGTSWLEELPRAIEENDTRSESATLELGNVTGLKAGSDYVMRVVLIDQGLKSYQGDLVPTVAFSTPCIVPGEMDYENEAAGAMYLRSINLRADAFMIEWQVPSSQKTWCRVVSYEVVVKMGWKWVTHSVDVDFNAKLLTGLLPGTRYTVKVRAKTTGGPASFSKPLNVTTLDQAPDHVVNLEATRRSQRSLNVTWNSPKHPAGTIHHYQLTYQCLQVGGCPIVDCSNSAGQMNVSTTSQLIEGLLPFAVYNISVAGVSGSVGPAASVQEATSNSVPEVAPSSVSPAITSLTNTSLGAQWAPPDNCTKINGFITGYRYELLPAGQATPLYVGTTPDCSASFYNLTPHAEYVVRVFVVTGAGWSSSEALNITANTRAVPPEVVEDLTVYKRGQHLLGLRWKEPLRPYGSLLSFTISHAAADDSQPLVRIKVEPTKCHAWPESYCYTIHNLKQDTNYNISVRARNTEVNEDGKEVTVTAITKESAPSALSDLSIPELSITSRSLIIECGIPYMINGLLRSIVVNVEKTEAYNSTEYYSNIPMKEKMVTTESHNYTFRLNGLRPASTYKVSLSAKTVALGPALSQIVHTRPPTPVLAYAPTLLGLVKGLPMVRVRLEDDAGYPADLVSGYLLLLKDNSSVNPSPIKDKWLAQHLKHSLNGSFSLVAEYPKDKLPELAGSVVVLGPGGQLWDGVFGQVGFSPLQPHTEYRLVWVVMLQYYDMLSEGHIVGAPFTVNHA